MISEFSDQVLKDTVNHNLSAGAVRAAGYLLKIEGENREELRSLAEACGNVYANTSPGWRYADGVRHMVLLVIRAGWTVEQLQAWYAGNR